MAAVPKIPLNERLQAAGPVTPNFLAAFELFVDDFFITVAKLTKSPYFEAIYHRYVAEYNDVNSGCVVSEIVHRADDLPQRQKLELLHTVLVSPFAALKS